MQTLYLDTIYVSIVRWFFVLSVCVGNLHDEPVWSFPPPLNHQMCPTLYSQECTLRNSNPSVCSCSLSLTLLSLAHPLLHFLSLPHFLTKSSFCLWPCPKLVSYTQFCFINFARYFLPRLWWGEFSLFDSIVFSHPRLPPHLVSMWKCSL